MTTSPVRAAVAADADALIDLWHAGWHNGHAGVVPDALTAIRTRADFAARLPPLLPQTLTAGPEGAPLGFCALEGDEIYQFYVSAEARGTGVAARLLAAGEGRIAARGQPVARLDVAIGNTRAIRFYTKSGWHEAGPVDVTLRTAGAGFPLTLLRMKKSLEPA